MIVIKEAEIKKAIEDTVTWNKLGKYSITSKYSIWTIGITDDPDRRKTEHGIPSFWLQWRADTETIARNVEKHFLEKGMKASPGFGGGRRRWRPRWHVYIF